ncbi:transcription initiation factor TFIID subunit 9-like [Halichondria panicea]|uniref:transcription initiation factor TFIID subunit 9-like n=1 Tax=Halichondria panicea TaxID=6063 RepID=UPI00312B76D2
MAEDGADGSTGPKDAAVMEAILKEMGVQEYDPNVVHQMLEFSYRYVTNVLEDARMYSEHAQKKEIDVSDVKLAVQTRVDHSFATPPPRDFLIEVARKKNSTPLPLIPEKFGPRLPPERYCLTANNYKLKEKQKAPSVQKPQVTLSATFRLPKQQTTTATSSLRTQLTSPLGSAPPGIGSNGTSMPTLTGKNTNTNNSRDTTLNTLIMNMPHISKLD